MTSPADFADKWVAAYNSGDLDQISSLLSDDVHLTHHGRGVEVHGRQAALELFRTYGAAFPDKAFTDRRSIASSGDRAFVEHTWSGTAEAAVPGWAEKGETVTLELATFLTVRDGLLVDYHDYG